MANVNLTRLALQHAAADASQYAYEDWENEQLCDADHDYPADYPVSSRASMTVGKYAKQYRRSQQVIVGSRSTAHG